MKTKVGILFPKRFDIGFNENLCDESKCAIYNFFSFRLSVCLSVRPTVCVFFLLFIWMIILNVHSVLYCLIVVLLCSWSWTFHNKETSVIKDLKHMFAYWVKSEYKFHTKWGFTPVDMEQYSLRIVRLWRYISIIAHFSKRISFNLIAHNNQMKNQFRSFLTQCHQTLSKTERRPFSILSITSPHCCLFFLSFFI